MKIQKYDSRFELRCFKSELALWHKRAKQEQMPLSEYVRQCLSKGKVSKSKSSVDPTLTRQLSAIGNNLNQIAFWVNTYKSQAEVVDILQKLDVLRQELTYLVEIQSQQVEHAD